MLRTNNLKEKYCAREKVCRTNNVTTNKHVQTSQLYALSSFHFFCFVIEQFCLRYYFSIFFVFVAHDKGIEFLPQIPIL